MLRAYAATPNRLPTNFACPSVSFSSNLLSRPLRIVFKASAPRIVPSVWVIAQA